MVNPIQTTQEKQTALMELKGHSPTRRHDGLPHKYAAIFRKRAGAVWNTYSSPVNLKPFFGGWRKKWATPKIPSNFIIHY